MTNRRLRLPFALLAALVFTVGCAKTEREEVFNGERSDESVKGLIDGHVHLFELVQWGSPGGGIIADKRARRDAMRLEIARREVELLEAKIKRGVMEEREMKVIRVQYPVDQWEREKDKVKRPPGGRIEPTTVTAPRQPNRAAHPVPGVIVEVYQEQKAKEVVKTPVEAAAYWGARLNEARVTFAREQESADARTRTSEAVDSAPLVAKTRVSFAMLPLPTRDVIFHPPHDPRGHAVDPAIATRRGSFLLRSLGGVLPEPPGLFADRAALEKGVEFAGPTTIHGLDSDSGRLLDSNNGKLVLKLVSHCPTRLNFVKEEVRVNPGFVIATSKSLGFAEWYEIPYPTCADEDALRTRVFDLVAGASARDEPALDTELFRLRSEIVHLDNQHDRITRMAAK